MSKARVVLFGLLLGSAGPVLSTPEQIAEGFNRGNIRFRVEVIDSTSESEAHWYWWLANGAGSTPSSTFSQVRFPPIRTEGL